MILRDAFDEFLKNRVNLNKTRLKRIKSAHQSVRAVLVADEWIADRLVGAGTWLQGSYALGTAIRSPLAGVPYDVDVVLGLDLEGRWGGLIRGADALHEVADALDAAPLYEGKVEVRERCLRVSYSDDGLSFHLDVVPVHIDAGHRDPVLITDGNEWHWTNPLGFIDWFNGVNRDGCGYLRRVTRLLKYWRDVQRLDGLNSMILTALAGAELPVRASSDDDALVKTLEGMAAWAQGQPEFEVPAVANPSLSDEDLARSWRWSEFREFRDAVTEAATAARRARDSKDEEEAVGCWNGPALFDGDFPTALRGLGAAQRQAAHQFASGGLLVAPGGRVNPDHGVRPSYNRGFYGDR